MRMGLRTCTLLATLTAFTTLGFAVDLINTSFESSEGWATQSYSAAPWSQTVNSQVWKGEFESPGAETPNVYGTTNGGKTGDRRSQFRAVGAYLLFPQVTDPGTLTFWAAKSGGDNTHTMMVQTSTAETGPWTDQLTYTNNATDMPANETWYQKQVVLNLTGSYYIRIQMTARSGNSAYIDDIVVTQKGTVGDDPDALITPDPVAFGKTNATGSKDKTFKVKNQGATQNLQINSPGLNFSGTNPDKFAIVGSPSFPITLTPGQETTLTVRYTPGEVAAHSASATLVSNDPNNPTISLSGEGVAVTDVANIAAARAEASGTNVRITGNVVVTVKTNGLNTGRGQFFIQDTSGTDGATAIWIDDVNNQIGQLFDIGDQVTGIVGTLGAFRSMIQIVPIGTCTKVGTVTPPAPKGITAADTNFELIQGELIRINGVTVDTQSHAVWGGDTVGTGVDYIMTPPAGVIISLVRLEEGSGLVGQPFLSGSFDIVGIATQYDSTLQIQPRLATDQTQATSVSNWSLY